MSLRYQSPPKYPPTPARMAPSTSRNLFPAGHGAASPPLEGARHAERDIALVRAHRGRLQDDLGEGTAQAHLELESGHRVIIRRGAVKVQHTGRSDIEGGIRDVLRCHSFQGVKDDDRIDETGHQFFPAGQFLLDLGQGLLHPDDLIIERAVFLAFLFDLRDITDEALPNREGPVNAPDDGKRGKDDGQGHQDPGQLDLGLRPVFRRQKVNPDHGSCTPRRARPIATQKTGPAPDKSSGAACTEPGWSWARGSPVSTRRPSSRSR